MKFTYKWLLTIQSTIQFLTVLVAIKLYIEHISPPKVKYTVSTNHYHTLHFMLQANTGSSTSDNAGIGEYHKFIVQESVTQNQQPRLTPRGTR